jgi:Ca2+-transporting ATPase
VSGALAAPHAESVEAVCEALRTDARSGLSEAMAEARLATAGPNRLPETKPPTRLDRLQRQLGNAMIVLLAAAAAISLAIGEWVDAGVIVAIVVLNTLLGYVQEGKAEDASRRIRELLAPRARVLRGGLVAEIDAAGVVPGDLVVLHGGDRVAADGRMIDAVRLEIDESALTGESLPVPKRSSPPTPLGAPLPDRATMAFAGTTATIGAGRFVVTATGTSTELGRIASAAASVRRDRTPLETRLDRLATQLLWAASAVCLALAAIAWLQGDELGDSLLIGVSLAVAAVPEGLPTVVTVALALGMRKMAAEGAIVRKLHAVETLGSTSVICADKTGTLTENRMRVSRLESSSEAPGDARETLALLEAALLASETWLAAGEPASDPTEQAIERAAADAGVVRSAVLNGGRVAQVEPFDPSTKRVSVVVESPSGERTRYAKGAPESLVDGLSVGAEDRRRLLSKASEWAANGGRVLLVARGPDGAGLLPLGLIELADPPRASSRPSVEEARRAGVRSVMITGDHPHTGLAIARATGIVPIADGTRVVRGADLDGMTDEELGRVVRNVNVFARVLPEQKLRIVQALTAAGEIVAMTGDGVNDVPSIRAAHIGIAMGRGTDAARAAADMILTDDNFATIVRAIRRGRAIYDNVQRFAFFLLSANAGEVLVYTAAIVAGMSAPLTVLQVLLVNLLTDGPPAVALGLDPPGRDVMSRRPRPRAEGLLDPIRGRLVVAGVTTGLAAFASFLIGEASSHSLGQTMAFTTLVFSQLALVFAVRGEAAFFRAGRNPTLYAAVLGSAAVQALVLAVGPIASGFDAVDMTVAQLAAAFGLALLPFGALELFKCWVRQTARPAAKP